MRTTTLATMALLGFVTAPAGAEVPVTLLGSPASMVRQNDVAHSLELTFVQTEAELRELERNGVLLRLPGNDHYDVAGFVTFPSARAELKLFIERLAAQYHEATGEKLVVTSLTRPASMQPANSHQLSVHPTGMAVDLRVSKRAASQQWLEGTLLSLEEQGLLDVTRERNPPHYHVALFPEPYMAHVERLIELERLAEPPPPIQVEPPPLAASAFLPVPEQSDAETAPRGVTLLGLAALILALPGGWLGRSFWRRQRSTQRS